MSIAGSGEGSRCRMHAWIRHFVEKEKHIYGPNLIILLSKVPSLTLYCEVNVCIRQLCEIQLDAVQNQVRSYVNHICLCCGAYPIEPHSLLLCLF